MPFVRQAVVLSGGDVIGAFKATVPESAGGGLVGVEVKASFVAEEEHHGLGDVHAVVAYRLKPI